MRVDAILLLLLAAAVAASAPGCESSPRVQVPKEVKVAVKVPCIDPDKRPKPPTVRSLAELMAMNEYHRTIAAWQDKLKVEKHAAELAALVEGCSRLPRE